MLRDFVRKLIADRRITAAHDLSDGGLAATLVEMCLASGRGAKIELPAGDAHVALFAEDQARYVITCTAGKAAALIDEAGQAGVPAPRIGTVTGNGLIVLGHATISLNMLREAHEGWFPAFMDG